MSESTEDAAVMPSEVLHGRVVQDSSAYAAVAHDAIEQLIKEAMVPPTMMEDRSISSEEQRRRWRINPATLHLEPEDGEHPGTFSAQDRHANQWPPCPVCGTTIDVACVLDVQTSQDPSPVYVMGKWQCPNNCDPRPVLREGHPDYRQEWAG